MTDEQLVDRVKNGDRDAYRQLVERYQAYVFSTILRMVRQRQLAEDLAQETFLQAYRSLPGFDGRSRFSSWLYRIAHNKAIDWSRSRAKKEQSGETELQDVYKTDDSVEDEVVIRDISRRLRQLISKMPPHYRDVLSMYFEQELSLGEIAEQLRVPRKTVQTRFIRGKKQLFQKWQEVNHRGLYTSTRADVALSRSGERRR